ncbi:MULTISPECIES: cell division protein FtsA [Bacillus]|uniref:cell division protein FtsA n=1 Tax=Bacillus TaxID=1386 RepID=UPI000BB6A3E8|nr:MULTISPECIES: cell division protein FtsA [Bacillus]
MSESSRVFALDIGTRSVVGLILENIDGKYNVLDIVIQEHKERAMLDGQIHDILAVASVISEVKLMLEARHGKLSKVCVAAAGRALKTRKSSASKEIYGTPLLNKDDIIFLELSGVQEAQRLLMREYEFASETQYFCVGYSVLHYYLDGEEIGSLLDQQGKMATVDIISTFLPKVVVESLISALQRADLELEALTLEPIAAINVLIPQSMRRLNVALIDIGAGTSDIAITNNGTVTAYGMVPIAGDEITEGLSDEFLLDFPNAETLKRELISQETVPFTDILGFQQTLSKSEIVDKIKPYIEKLAIGITKEVLKQNNNKPPKAVMLVGGGSLTPLLPYYVAKHLQLPENRVAIRGLDAIQLLDTSSLLQRGPELVTPIGIAIAAKEKPIHYVSVTVNGLSIRLFDVKQLTIGDALLAAGIELKKMYGKPGLAHMVEYNGKMMTFPGGLGQPPTIIKNGQLTNIQSSICNNDEITITKGDDGLSKSIKVRDVITVDLADKNIKINGESFTISPVYFKNGVNVSIDEIVTDRDKITANFPSTISEVVEATGMTKLDNTIYTVYINNEEVPFPNFSTKILWNGQQVTGNTTFSSGDEIIILPMDSPDASSLIQELKLVMEETIEVLYNNKLITLTQPLVKIMRNGELLKDDEIISHGDHLQLTEIKKERFIFQDIFKFVDLDKPTQFKKLIMKKNGVEATFFEPIAHGDSLELYWE